MAPQHQLAQFTLQPRLTIGPVDDPYEREAERVAAAVMRMPAPVVQRAALSVQRCSRCAGKTKVEEMCPGCAAKARASGLLQREAAPGAASEVSPAVEAQISALRGGGAPMGAELRAFMEPRFGHDFSSVRIHTGPSAATLARSVGALAFTLGSDVVFGAGQYRPADNSGRHLIAHELTHVVQQDSFVHLWPDFFSTKRRKLTSYEQEEAHRVFGESINLALVFVEENSLMSLGGYVRTPQNTIYYPKGTLSRRLNMPLLIHELAHVWQTQKGISVLKKAYWAIQGESAYKYGEEKGLVAAILAGRCFKDFNTEQQGNILRDYYIRLVCNDNTDAWEPFIREVQSGECQTTEWIEYFQIESTDNYG